MTTPDNEILVLTTHYPYGTVEENWIACELDELPQHFGKVHVLPVKELEGCRTLPEGIELWSPLAGCNRLKFFAFQALKPQTWRYFLSALRECIHVSKITVPRANVCFKFSCYRAAFEQNTRLKSFLASRSPKVVYSYWGHIPALAIPMSRKSGAGTCVRFHRVDLMADGPEQGFFPWRQDLRQASDLSVFVSLAGQTFYSERMQGHPLGNTGVFRLGTRDFGEPQIPQKRSETSPITMISASWIVPIKRVELIAGLATELTRRGKTIMWHHFGGRTTVEVDRAIEVARQAGVTVVQHGLVPVEQIQSFYREHDVTFFVNLSDHEGVPVSIMEALNAGIPVVATAVGGTSEVVIEGRSGLLVEPGVDKGLAALATRILNELQIGGLLSTAQPREVWEEFCDGHGNAKVLATSLVSLAR
jgi:colanic acid/amylovoran biosynthesis glycosyltransferase